MKTMKTLIHRMTACWIILTGKLPTVVMTVNDNEKEDVMELATHTFGIIPTEVFSYLLVHIYQNLDEYPKLHNVWKRVMSDYALTMLKRGGVELSDLEKAAQSLNNAPNASIN